MKTKISRRDILGLGVAATAAAGCSRAAYVVGREPIPETIEPPKIPEQSRRAAERVGFGARPGELSVIERTGIPAWIESQLEANQPTPPILAFHLARLDVLRIHGNELRDMPEDVMVSQLQQAAILRALLNPNQLFERMADFWSNHLNVYARKGLASYRLGFAGEKVVRPHALGSFAEMIRSSAKSAAMLAYLDNIQNSNRGPNENYARELMELHTLGVEGGYTQQDVREVARCFTGWTVERRFLRPYDNLIYVDELHDDGEKVVLGHKIPAGGGKADVDRVLDILIEHPQTAKFIAQKLGNHFLGTKEGSEVETAAKEFQNSKGDIRQTLRPILFSDRLLTGASIVKRPLDFAVSAMRALAAETDGGRPLQGHMASMGQPLFEWPMPDGFPDRTSAWTGSLLARWNFAFALTHGQISGTRVPLDEIKTKSQTASFSRLIVGQNVPETHADDLRQEAALTLCHPDFMWR